MPFTPFKICSKCGVEWVKRTSFLCDPNIQIVGYQVHFDQLQAGLFLFNHNCRTTLAIEAGEFKDLYNGPIYNEKLTTTEDCKGRCLELTDLYPCLSQCECAYVRNIAQMILHWPKDVPSLNEKA